MSSGTPYIGSKISLVSKAEIRYEGFLYTIDQNDSTVTLAKVISLGTEDRVPGAGAVPAREEVFEYIVFRGSDIKDLHVCEGPKKVEDPAIVMHSHSQSYNPNYHREPPFPAGGMPNFGYNPFNIPQNVPVDIPHQSSRQQTPPNLPRNDRGSQNNRNQAGNFQDSRNKARGPNSSSSRPDSKEGRSTREYFNEPRDNSRDERDDDRDGRNRFSRDNRNRGNRADKKDRRDQRSSREYRDDYHKEVIDNKAHSDIADNRKSRDNRDNRDNRYRDNRNSRENRSSRYVRRDDKEDKDYQQRSGSEGSRGQSRGRGRGGGRANNRRGVPRGGGGNTSTKFTEDFDFESANAKFNKEEIETELLRVLKKVKISDENGSGLEDMEEREMDERAPLPSPDKYYDRSKSFFDSILCEAMVPKSEDEVMTRRQEQALNSETFGSSAAHYRPGYRGRGRGRGRWRGQGRGYYRGRGNFRGNSNRRWVDYDFDYEAAGIKNKQQPVKASNDV